MSSTPVSPTWGATLPVSAAELPPAHAAAPEHDALANGIRLDEFEIVRVLGAGGFGIVYLALDHVLLRYVAIKEYMPTALAGRSTGATVAVRSAALADTFAMGLESFFNEARMLAGFDHPSLVKVYRFWKANGTAYMVMPYYPGHTLKEARRAMRGSPDEAWLRSFMEPLLGALAVLHGQAVYHRDITPDNILLLPDGRPVLLDFGSARRVIGDRTQSLTAILKPNFAPVEQYADEDSMRQGPWTDLYSLGATTHFMLTGQSPTPAVVRAVRDGLPALAAREGVLYPGVPPKFLAAIDWMLALAPDARPQSVAALQAVLNGAAQPGPLAGDAAGGASAHASTPAATVRAVATSHDALDASVTAPLEARAAVPTENSHAAAATGSASQPAEAAVAPIMPTGLAAPKPAGRVAAKPRSDWLATLAAPSTLKSTALKSTLHGRRVAAFGALALLVAGAFGWAALRPDAATADASQAGIADAHVSATPAPPSTAPDAASGALLAGPSPMSTPTSASTATAAALRPVPPVSPLPSAAPEVLAAVAATEAAASARANVNPNANASANASASAKRSVAAASKLAAAPASAAPRSAAARVAATPSAASAGREAMATTTTAAPGARAPEPPPATLVAAAPEVGPLAACEGLNFFSRALCVSRECAAPQWRAHPRCVDVRRADEQRQRRMEQ